MQPLSYQTTAVTCWVTSMLNAILLLRGVDEIPFRVCRELNGLVPARGRNANRGVFYYNRDQLNRYENAIASIGEITNLDIYYRKDDDVEVAIRDLNFGHQVAVCDIHDGWHSILLINKKNDCYYGFDPCWEYVSPHQLTGLYETLPEHLPDDLRSVERNSVNVMVKDCHLLGQMNRGRCRKNTGAGYNNKDNKFKIGSYSRHITILAARPG